MDNRDRQAVKPWDEAWRKAGRAWFEQSAFLDEITACFEAAGPLRAPLLDVGCGRGRLIGHLRARLGGRAWGADCALSSLRQGASGCVQAGACDLPFGDAVCNTVTAVLIIEHLPDYRPFLTEASRVLRPGGRLHLVFPNLYSLVTPALFAQRRILSRREAPWHRPLSAKEAAAALEGAGFRLKRVDYLSIGRHRGGLGRLFSDVVRAAMPARFREEIVMTGEKA
jgi:SAM-dependent methyltransferase